ncbi:MAG: DUF2079 domain-containing protein [Candidatus Lutacidiplasmatales archaeon]
MSGPSTPAARRTPPEFDFGDDDLAPRPSVASSRSVRRARPEVDRFAWLPAWVPRISLTVWVLALFATVETAFLSYIQWRNYLSFLPTQGDLGDYNQAYYTTVHGQGLMYYTTNLPGGSSGSIFAVHFSPFLLALVPFYAIAQGPTTLIILKQAALCFGVLPLYGLAKVYFRKPLAPIALAVLYLVSPVTVATDWNSFDPEVFLPILLLVSLYFFARGRFWPFVAFWILAMSTIEAASGLMLLFAVGALVGTFLPSWFSQMVSPYWTQAQQRRPLFIAFALSVGWLVLAFGALTLTGGRGGGFGDAYATRYTILGATSLPNVLVRAISDPGAAGAALQFGGTQKATYLVLILAATGLVSVLGGLRYLLPITGYFTLALLSNNPAFYLFGTEYSALVAGFLIAGSVEGAARLAMYARGTDALEAHQRIGARLRAFAQRMIARVRPVPLGEGTPPPAVLRLKAAIADLRNDQLGSAESRLVRVKRELDLDPRFRGPAEVPRPEPAAQSQSYGLGPRLRRRGLLPGAEDRGATAVFVIILLAGLAAAGAANPLGRAPVAADLQIQAGNMAPTAHEKALVSVLKMIPKDASVLTVSHLFPQLSNRPNAFVVPDHAFLPVPENYSYDVNNWVHKANYIAADYIVDPQNTLMLLTVANLAGFGLLASDAGAVVYERGWNGAPALWVPWTLSVDPTTLHTKYGNLVNQSTGPAYYHPAGGPRGAQLWDVPNAPFLPRGTYKATFSFGITAPTSNSTKPTLLRFNVTENPGTVRDSLALTLHGRSYHVATYHPAFDAAGNAITLTLQQGWLNVSYPVNHLTNTNRTLFFTVNQLGFVDFPGVEISKTMSVYLYAIVVTQLTAT